MLLFYAKSYSATAHKNIEDVAKISNTGYCRKTTIEHSSISLRSSFTSTPEKTHRRHYFLVQDCISDIGILLLSQFIRKILTHKIYIPINRLNPCLSSVLRGNPPRIRAIINKL